MIRDDKSETEPLDRLLAEARARQDDLPPGLSARVLADAVRLQPVSPLRPRRRGLRAWVDSFGGWPALGGLVAASCVGFWVGLSPPEGLYDPGAILFAPESSGIEDAASMSGFGWDVLEG